jgi:hypothetical protein
MKPSALRIERLLAKVEAESHSFCEHETRETQEDSGAVPTTGGEAGAP